MGCSISRFCENTMSVFHRKSDNGVNLKTVVERKLYLAKESPEPVFDLSECQLKQVPSGIYSICKVFRKDHLYLNNNILTTLEDGGQMSDLCLIKVLNISHNNFSQLHSDIKYLISLTELYLQGNSLKFLPESISHLKSLKILDVSKNKLKDLTASLGELKKMRKLNITGNPNLNKLCPELCLATNLTTLELEGDKFIFPPSEITNLGITHIMKYLCDYMNIEYLPPSLLSKEPSPVQSPSTSLNPFMKQPMLSWEEQEAAIMEQENKMHQMSKQQRDLFLSEIIKEQSILDAEIAKVQELREQDRQKLIRTILEDEKEIESLVNQFIESTNLKPEVIQQQLLYEEAELNRLLEITRQSYSNIKKNDILKAMETLIEENCVFQETKRNYDMYLDNIKRNMLIQELECTEKLEELLKAKDNCHSSLVEQLLEDLDLQKAMVATLLEKVDAKSWSLNQEISLISVNLAKLSVIEQEKQKLHVSYNYNQLLHQRMQLLEVLDDLLNQQNNRRSQLIDTLKEMESDKTAKTDFWLRNYQKLLDSAPKNLLNVQKVLDPCLANNLLKEGVIHCLPFLVKFLFAEESLLHITDEQLKANGIQLSSDREHVLLAIQEYFNTKNMSVCSPSAPCLEEVNCNGVLDNKDIDHSSLESECVICMDAKCEVVLVPCGHMCCCLVCCDNKMINCPMCRSNIERKIKVLIP